MSRRFIDSGNSSCVTSDVVEGDYTKVMATQKIPVYFSEAMKADIGKHASPSSLKPGILAEALKVSDLPIIFCEPKPLSVDDISLAHSREYVEAVLSGKKRNGFGNYSEAVRLSLPHTTGAMYDAALSARS